MSAGTTRASAKFTGQYVDGESGLYNLRARYYDPSTAQFLTLDPLVSKTLMPYEYVADNPLNGADPSGMACWAPWDSKCQVNLPGDVCLANGNAHCGGGDTGFSNLQDNLADPHSPGIIKAVRTFSAPIALGVDLGHQIRGDDVPPQNYVLDAVGFIPFGGAFGVGGRTWTAIQAGRTFGSEAVRACEEIGIFILKQIGGHLRGQDQ